MSVVDKLFRPRVLISFAIASLLILSFYAGLVMSTQKNNPAEGGEGRPTLDPDSTIEDKYPHDPSKGDDNGNSGDGSSSHVPYKRPGGDPKDRVYRVTKPESRSMGIRLELIETFSGPERRIGVTLAVTSRSTKSKKMADQPILRFLDSLANTVEPGYLYGVYLGYDSGDEVWDNEKEREWLKTWFNEKFPDGSDKGNVLLSLHVYEDTHHDNVRATNYVTLTSFDEGFDYFYRLNDDSRFISPKWATRMLQEFEELDDIGVVGPIDHFNSRILTHDMVSRAHIEIFGYHFPFAFKNWYSDDWVTMVYPKERTRMLKDIEVKHDTTFGERYDRWNRGKDDLHKEVAEGLKKILQYMKDHGLPEDGSIRSRGGTTAVIVVNAWNDHWCSHAKKTIEEVSPKINDFVSKMRSRSAENGGAAFIVFSPEDVAGKYEDTPQRKLMKMRDGSAKSDGPLSEEAKAVLLHGLPMSTDANRACGGSPEKKWSGMHKSIQMADGDGFTVSGQELHAELQKRHIRRVIFTGFFLNTHMMMSSPVNALQMWAWNYDVVLAKELVETDQRVPISDPEHVKTKQEVLSFLQKKFAFKVSAVDDLLRQQ